MYRRAGMHTYQTITRRSIDEVRESLAEKLRAARKLHEEPERRSKRELENVDGDVPLLDCAPPELPAFPPIPPEVMAVHSGLEYSDQHILGSMAYADAFRETATPSDYHAALIMADAYLRDCARIADEYAIAVRRANDDHVRRESAAAISLAQLMGAGTRRGRMRRKA
jgi:hypothetical protein